jgi:hypothetical protein
MLKQQLRAVFVHRDVAFADLLDAWTECRATVRLLWTPIGPGWPSATSQVLLGFAARAPSPGSSANGWRQTDRVPPPRRPAPVARALVTPTGAGCLDTDVIDWHSGEP